jgi:hypothetical protein
VPCIKSVRTFAIVRDSVDCPAAKAITPSLDCQGKWFRQTAASFCSQRLWLKVIHASGLPPDVRKRSALPFGSQ